MKTTIVRVGNSQGLRIPKPFLSQCGLEGEVEMLIRGHELVVHKVHRPREGWDEAFHKMARLGDDALLDQDTPTSTTWDAEGWEWK